MAVWTQNTRWTCDVHRLFVHVTSLTLQVKRRFQIEKIYPASKIQQTCVNRRKNVEIYVVHSSESEDQTPHFQVPLDQAPQWPGDYPKQLCQNALLGCKSWEMWKFSLRIGDCMRLLMLGKDTR